MSTGSKYYSGIWSIIREARLEREASPKPPRRQPGPRRLLILACSQRKSPDPGRIRAIERYQGPLWQTLRMADPDGRVATVAFLSARHGFGNARLQSIEDYNERLTKRIARQMIEHNPAEHWPPTPPRHRRMPSGWSPIGEIACMTNGDQGPFIEVCLVGGALYLEVMRSLVCQFRTPPRTCFDDRPHPYITEGAEVHEINGPIGVMRRELRSWLARKSDR